MSKQPTGYSGTPLVKKLGIKSDFAMAVVAQRVCCESYVPRFSRTLVSW